MEWRLAAARLTLPEKQHKSVSNQIPQHGITRDPVFLRTRSASSRNVASRCLAF
jgi:hypothetical protein